MKWLRIAEYVIFLIIVFRVVTLTQSFLPKLAPGFDGRAVSYRTAYEHSQYMVKNPDGFIPDETVNAYAGYAYAHGTMPILIAPDTPPLGRYMIGWLGMVTGSEHTATFVFYLASLLLLAALSFRIVRYPVVRLLPVIWFLWDPLITNQLLYTPLLDIQQLAWLLASLWLFGAGITSKKHTGVFFVGTQVAIGAFAATKFYMSALPVIAAYTATVWFVKRDALRLWLVMLPISLFVLLGTYMSLLWHGYTIRKFLGVQRYIYEYHKSQLLYPFSVWDLLLFNRWHVWFGDSPIISDSQWNISWPLVTVLGLIGAWISAVRRSRLVLPLGAYGLFYLLFLSIGQTTTRYFIVLLPVLAALSAYAIGMGVDAWLDHRKVSPYAKRTKKD
jgi:hypothetical protein